MKRWAINALLALVWLYRRLVSPALPRRCKYEPTCSAYAVDAIKKLGVVRGSIVAAWRLLRCNPLSHGGHDPLESRRLFRDRAAGSPRDRRTGPRAAGTGGAA